MSEISDKTDKLLLNYSWLFWSPFLLGHSVWCFDAVCSATQEKKCFAPTILSLTWRGVTRENWQVTWKT